VKQNTQNRTCITIRIHNHNNKNTYIQNDFTVRSFFMCVPTRCFLGDQNEEERCVGYVTRRSKKRKAFRLFMGRPEGKR
jgi:hypothetical protein